MFFQDDIHHQGRISALLNRLANYHAGIEPNTSEKKKLQPKVNMLLSNFNTLSIIRPHKLPVK